jgi:hypothetical protein
MRNFINLIETANFMESTRYFDGFSTVPTPADTQRYMRGWCPYFALALHDLYGFEIVGAAEHFACRMPDGRFVDIRGVMTPEQFEDGFTNAHVFDMSREEVVADIELGDFKCGFYNERDLAKAKALVKKLKIQ